MKRTILVLTIILGVVQIEAQNVKITENHNAALRYWMAFALMQDTPTDAATNKLVQDILSGSTSWDEAKLGAIIDQNTEAILTMQRGTKLPECDWGLEYDLGPDAPIAHLAKARVLARFNVLYGIRMAAKHQDDKAVEAWIDGLRFSEHLAQGASLIGALTAKAALVSDLRAINNAVHGGSLDSTSVSKVEEAVKALPEYGFDWGHAVAVESAGIETGLRQFKNSAHPDELYRSWFGTVMPANISVPGNADISRYQIVMMQAAAAFREPYESAKARLPVVQAEIATLNPIIKMSIPLLPRINDQREEIAIERSNLLK